MFYRVLLILLNGKLEATNRFIAVNDDSVRVYASFYPFQLEWFIAFPEIHETELNTLYYIQTAASYVRRIRLHSRAKYL